MLRLGFGYLWPVVAALIAVTVAVPAGLTSRSVSSDVLQQLDLFSQYAAASYCTNNVNSNSTGAKLTCAVGNCASVEKADTKTLYEFSNTGDYGDIAGFLAADTTNKLLVVSFRGSRSVDNWIADVDFPQESVDLCSGCWAHNGFWESWQAVANVLPGKLKSAIAGYSGYTVVFTGHSFGAAMATLGATALRNDGLNIDLYTFGCPRVGNQALAEYITAQGTLYRVTHTNDIVPKLPPKELGFSHPGPEYWITSGDGDPVGTGDIKVFQGTDSTGGNADAKGDSVLAHQFYFEAITICL